MESNHFTTYLYYKGLHFTSCEACLYEGHHLMLRYRTYFFSNHPFIPTRNNYYLVCSQCGCYEEIENEATLMQLLHKGRGQTPIKYDKHFTKDRATPIIDKLKANILVHLDDMKIQD